MDPMLSSDDGTNLAAAEQVVQLQAKLTQTEAALRRERHRADILAAELQRLRRAAASTTTPPAASLDPGGATANGTSDSDGDELVQVPRRTLELLALKERAMDAVKEGITIADATSPDMPLIYVNEGFEKITGYPIDYALGRNCRFLQGEGTDQEHVLQLRTAMEAGQPCVVQLMNYKRSGDPFINYLSLTPVHDAAGCLTHYVGVQADITELVQQRQAELSAKHAAVTAAAATEAKSQFVARMSHEIRTPLNGMIAVGQLLAETPLNPQQWDLLSTIQCSGDALLTLITDILDFSKIEANKMVLCRAPFRPESTIEAAIEIAGLQAAHKRLQVAYHCHPEVPRALVGDAPRLQQILLNILINALKFTDAGEVLLEVWAEPVEQQQQQQGGEQGTDPGWSDPPQPAAGTATEGFSPPAAAPAAAATTCSSPGTSGRSSNDSMRSGASAQGSGDLWDIHFCVRDTGIGIAPDGIRLLFQSFSQVDASPTRRFGGSGLGLAISQKLSEAMGGRMWVESAGLGRGSTFRWFIRAPSAPEAAIRPGPQWPLQSMVLGAVGGEGSGLLAGKRVLVVEGCDTVRQVMGRALRHWGCQVCCVPSQLAALAQLKLKDPAAQAEAAADAAAAAVAAASGSHAPDDSLAPLPRLTLRPSGGVPAAEEEAAACCSGPFDVVIMDVTHTALLQMMMQHCDESEAQRVIFTGWPGHNDPESEDGSRSERAAEGGTAPAGTLPQALPVHDPRGSAVVAQLPRELTDAAQQPPGGQRALGYVVVTRPVRQGRLRLAMEEVLAMEIDHAPAGAAANGGLARNPSNDAAAVGGLPGVSEDGSEDGRSLGSSSSLRHAPVKRVGSTGNIQDVVKENSTRRLLLAEDNLINMKVALGILRRLGFTDVVTAADGDEAVAAVAAVGGPDAFDVILMDLHMPNKGGIEAVIDIRRQWPNHRTKIIAVTADAFEDTRDKCIANGFTGWLAKPFRVEEFARAMEQDP